MSSRRLALRMALASVLALPLSASAQTGPKLVSVTLSPTQVFWGQPVTATVRLDQAAPAGGFQVVIGVCNSFTYVPEPPGTVVVPAGQTSYAFQVTPNPQGTGWGGGRPTCVRAQTFNPDVALESNWLEIAEIATYIVLPASQAYGGQRLSGQVRMGTIPLNSTTVVGAFPALQDIAITLGQAASGDIQAGGIRFPSGDHVTIRAGTTSAPFDFQMPDVLWEQDYRVTKAGGGPYGTFQIIKAKVNAVAGVSVSPRTIPGGGTGTGTVTLYATAGFGGAKVSLRASGASVSLPAEVTVPEGQSSTTFPIQLGSVTTAGPVTLTASRAYPANWASARLEIQATFQAQQGQAPNITITEVTVTPTAVRGGQTATGRVKLSSNAPAGGISVNLYRMGGCCADIPSGVAIPAGNSSVTFDIRTSPQIETTTPEIQAAVFQSFKSALLRVIGSEVESFVVPQVVYSGGSFQIKVRLVWPTPQSSALSFALSSNDPVGVPVPSAITVAAGQQEAAVTVQTPASPVDKTVKIRLTQSLIGVDRSADVVVKPPRVQMQQKPQIPTEQLQREQPRRQITPLPPPKR